jgi:hypothetical protein
MESLEGWQFLSDGEGPAAMPAAELPIVSGRELAGAAANHTLAELPLSPHSLDDRLETGGFVVFDNAAGPAYCVRCCRSFASQQSRFGVLALEVRWRCPRAVYRSTPHSCQHSSGVSASAKPVADISHLPTQDVVRSEIELLHDIGLLEPSKNKLTTSRNSDGSSAAGHELPKKGVFELDLVVNGEVRAPHALVRCCAFSGRNPLEDAIGSHACSLEALPCV